MSNVTIKIKKVKGEDIYVGTKQKESIPPFWKLGGNMGYNRSNFPAYENLTGVMKEISKGANWFFWLLLERRNYSTNIAIITPKTPTEAKKITRAYQELYKLHIVARIRRQHYILNPAVIQPPNDLYESVFLNWEDNKGESND